MVKVGFFLLQLLVSIRMYYSTKFIFYIIWYISEEIRENKSSYLSRL